MARERGLQAEILASLAVVALTATVALGALVVKGHQAEVERLRKLAARGLLELAESPLEPGNPALQLPLAAPLLLPGQRLPAALEQPLPPRVIQRFGDLMPPAQLLDRHVAAQASQHDLQLLLRGKRPVLLRDCPGCDAYLEQMRATVRLTRGRDIDAACGQLAAKAA